MNKIIQRFPGFELKVVEKDAYCKICIFPDSADILIDGVCSDCHTRYFLFPVRNKEGIPLDAEKTIEAALERSFSLMREYIMDDVYNLSKTPRIDEYRELSAEVAEACEFMLTAWKGYCISKSETNLINFGKPK